MSSTHSRPRPRRRAQPDREKDLLLAWTDEVCNNDEVPEVEIVSLLHEHIPKYRLRADSLTQFGGYENQDWFIPSPALKVAPEDLALSPDQIRETLNYFLLCSNRVSQMTKTYNDIEAVTRLLEEKEKDLEITARIGKELLAANGRLEARVSALESELRAERDTLTQLRHELNTKTELLQVLTNDTEEGEDWGSGEAGERALALQRRTGALERENRALREEATKLAAGADSAEAAERQLLRDIAQQLSSANSEALARDAELYAEREARSELESQLAHVTSRMHTAERALQQLTLEHEQAVRILEITKENQDALALELADSKERYAEVLALLAEAQEQIRALRRGRGGAGSVLSGGGGALAGLMPSVAAAAGLHSLHREMHSSVYSDLSLDSGIADPSASSSVQKVFETVQCASRWSGSMLGSEGAELPPRLAAPPYKPSSSDSFMDDGSDAESEDLYPGGTGGSGVPGVPGAAELAAALRRLTPHEIDSRRATLAASHLKYKPEGEESAVWGAGAGGGLAGNKWRLPHKLQIVKPLEGSLTLHTWAQLAKPTMSGLLEEQLGVGVRGGGTGAGGLGGALYRLSDVEEDDECPRMPHAALTYTLTDTRVLHPGASRPLSAATSLTPSALSSLSSSVLGSAWSSRRSSAAASPTHSRRASLALHPAAHTAPHAAPPALSRYSPTATPANSPLLGSPDSSPPGTPVGGAPSLHTLIASGTSLLRRTFMPTVTEGAAAAPSPLALQTPGSLYTGLVHRSPMEQLTCLKRALRSPSSGASEAAERRESVSEPGLGVPAQPGSGALEREARGRRGVARVARPRTDLGTVGAPPPAPTQHSSPLGTLSSLLFGRKGGLL